MKTNFNYVTPNIMSGIDELDKEKFSALTIFMPNLKKEKDVLSL